MGIEKLSLKALTISVLLVLGAMTIATSLVSESEYRDAALSSQADAVARTLQVASEAVMDSLHTEMEQLGRAEARTLAMRSDFFSYLAEAPAGTANPTLTALLEAPLKTPRQYARPVAVRLYNAGHELLMQNQAEGTDLGGAVPPFVQQADPDGIRAGLWQSAQGPLYSLVVPIRNRQAGGFLEIVADPVAALQKVAELTGLPLRIATPAGRRLLETGTWEPAPPTAHRIDHVIRDDDGNPVLELSALDDFSALYRSTEKTRDTIILFLVALIGAGLLAAMLILNRLLFRPVNAMIADMHRVAEGDTSVSVHGRSLKEFDALAGAFNRMTRKIQDIIEHERQAAEDVKGKVELIQEVVAMAAEGDLTGQIMVYRDKDIISELAEGIQQMLDSLNSLVSRIQQSGIQVTSSATEIAATAKQQEATVTEQAATTNQIKATVTEITATSRELVNTMNEVTEVAWKTSESANAGRSSLQRMEKTMHQMMEATESIGSKLAVLSEKAGNINTVVTTINRVADQTNLLSLNAAIEAEKAGEYGVGFAVVATEIRRLADQTAVATWDIEQMVKEMQSAVSAGVMGMEKFSEEVRHGVEDVRQVGAQLAQIIEQVETLIPRFEEVHEGMTSQAQGGQQIRDAIVQLSESAQQTADSLRQSNGAIQQLNEAAARLQEGASHFRVNS